jgi:hypothetical protein
MFELSAVLIKIFKTPDEASSYDYVQICGAAALSIAVMIGIYIFYRMVSERAKDKKFNRRMGRE